MFQHHQILLQQDDVRRFLRHIHGGVHRDADIRGFHCGGVIDAVTHETDRMAVFSQHRDHARFLIRGQLGEHIRCLRGLRKLLVVHALQVGAEKHVAHLQADLLADRASHLVVVTGQDLGGHAMVPQRLDGIGGGLFRRIEEGEVSEQHHVAFVLHAERAYCGGIALLRDGEDPEALVVEAVHSFENPVAHGVGQWLHVTVVFSVGANGQHLLDGAFRHHLGLARLILHHCGQPASGEIKRNLIHLRVVFRQVDETRVRCLLLFRLADYRQIH